MSRNFQAVRSQSAIHNEKERSVSCCSGTEYKGIKIQQIYYLKNKNLIKCYIFSNKHPYLRIDFAINSVNFHPKT